MQSGQEDYQGDDGDNDYISQLAPGQIANLPPLHQLVGRNWVTLKQVARLIGVQYRTVLRWKRDGKVKTIKVGGNYRVYEEELRRFLSEGNFTQ